ncbi:phenylalanine--tRNA ligase subunit alpha [Heliobacterium chlorum]|uniref:Phenylalanine--tRNA ligase alpha subunit n=1 Tax=Heliobacterium chlorum TaxID=2698 RepID=A0ABR7T1N6_HELCL|nr:phenylalanine--tRNA ligase subunit alpha [Heliobacterium chlorum]MBC9783759.1 phenylalanine--tRNA ligase subunit alpha [Heliobacterium chlorum]
MREQLERIRLQAADELQGVEGTEALQDWRVRYLGKKGELTQILRGMGAVPAEERPAMGALVNEVRAAIEFMLEEKSRQLKEKEKQARLASESIDITLPGQVALVGSKHPLTLVIDEIKQIFLGMGYEIAEGPEVETDYYNFEALNLPQDHPARDMQDSFYITPDILLRTHTSPVQIRAMERIRPQLPVKVICPGRVFRRDDDATHSPMFHQVEGLVVDKSITFGDLRGTLLTFARQMFGPEREIRLRPSFFPFTEPSAEVDISCGCGGSGCRVCKGTGWLEILGSGMVHPNVLKYGGYDPQEVTGFAFGMGVERIAMLKYGIDDMRLLYENDMRFLSQF